jgi:hypothetical protein
MAQKLPEITQSSIVEGGNLHVLLPKISTDEIRTRLESLEKTVQLFKKCGVSSISLLFSRGMEMCYLISKVPKGEFSSSGKIQTPSTILEMQSSGFRFFAFDTGEEVFPSKTVQIFVSQRVYLLFEKES